MRYLVFLCILSSALNHYTKPNNPARSKSNAAIKSDSIIAIPCAGNSWVVNNWHNDAEITGKNGIQHWSNPQTIIKTYFKTKGTGTLHVALRAKVPLGYSIIQVKVGDETRKVKIGNAEYDDVDVGDFEIKAPGYHFVKLEGLEKSSGDFAEIQDVLVSGPVASAGIIFVKDDFYFGRRGPSVHLRYETPEGKDIKWFYNEITVPEGEDVIGSYFMADGFGEGYFGMQVNSENERRVLFSVWSPFKTQDPKQIPEDYRIRLLGKGDGVHSGEFGNEGSGGQSYWVFPWRAGHTYRFLLKCEPTANGATDYTAYFYAPEVGKWKLIASFSRPHTQTYLTHLYSFLENFIPSTGYMARKGYYSNQWVCDSKGQWHELTNAKFTADATARKGARLDYAGGVEANRFFLENCGFFNKTTPMDTPLVREANGSAPDIDFSMLETPGN